MKTFQLDLILFPIAVSNPEYFLRTLGDRYIGLLGAAICRRQKIERVEVYQEAYYCDIETWLLFLCMRDDDVQENQLRHPEEYNTYLGGRAESSVFIDMAQQRCDRRIGAIPKNAIPKITPRSTPVRFRSEHAQRVFVMASFIANYDYVLIRKRRRMRRPQDQIDPNECRDMSLLRNGGRLYRRVLERAGDEMRNEYDSHWFFCNFVGSPPYRNIRPEKRNHKGRLLTVLKNSSDLSMHGKEL